MAGPQVDILMYHSISEAGGPTSVSPSAFRAQMTAIAEAGVPVIGLDDLLRGKVLRDSVILTFDDGFQDFADLAWPVMEGYGFRPIVYLPTAHVGRCEDWPGGHPDKRPLMGWPVIRELARAGVEFGSHSVSHPNLDTLAPDVLEAELKQSRDVIEQKLGRAVRHFAPPYGAAGPGVRTRIAAHYASSVSVVLGRAGVQDDRFNLPRLEMFYFAQGGHWVRHLAGRGGPYLAGRRMLRSVRSALTAPRASIMR